MARIVEIKDDDSTEAPISSDDEVAQMSRPLAPGYAGDSSDDDDHQPDSGQALGNCCGCCATCIPSGSVGVVQDLGEYKGWVEPGCVCYMPIFRTIEPISLAVSMLDCTSDCKTKDNVLVTVKTAVQYRVNKKKIKEAKFDIVDPENQIQAYVDSVLRSFLPTLDLDEAFSAKDHIMNEIHESVRKSMARYGHDILKVLITDLQPEASVQQAMNAINKAKREREAATEQAEAQKLIAVKAAEADAQAKFLSGEGMARMRIAMSQGIKQSMQEMSSAGLSPQEAMHMMVTTQYIDTLKDFANNPNCGSIMVPHGPGATANIEAQVRDGFIQAGALSRPRQLGM